LNVKSLVWGGMGLALAITAPGAIWAHGAAWGAHHPARAEDNGRIHKQKKRLKKDLKDGKITQSQYDAQVKDLNTIKKEENLDARANENGGHLTAGQQQAIKQQLNESHQDIKQMEGAAPAPAAPAN